MKIDIVGSVTKLQPYSKAKGLCGAYMIIY